MALIPERVLSGKARSQRRTQAKPWLADKERERYEAIRNNRYGKPFIVWDGEGCNSRSDGTMSYVLFGFYDSDSDTYDYISGPQLSTHECLQFLYETWQDTKDSIHVSFGFGFDTDQILRDLPTPKLVELRSNNEVKYEGYTIRYIPRKFFSVGKGKSRGITVFDAITFFHGSLVNTAKLYVPDDRRIPVVSKGKDARDSFEFRELDSKILPYWRLENQLFHNVMIALRRSLEGAGINLTSWHGPGAVAEALIVRERIASHIVESRMEMPVQVTDATAYAYFGGRFENPVCGYIPGPIYSYDIRSAYPAALANCPMLENGSWRHWDSPSFDELDVWGIYRVTNHGKPDGSLLGMGPLPHRGDDGTVCFPLKCSGWYYGHEVIAALMTGWYVQIHEGWTYERTHSYSPFQFLHEMYLQRADYKRAGNPAELACKLGLSSVYGKLAQLTGWDEVQKTPPKYHHQWYAGHATSWTRARIWLAMSQDPNAIVACETDGIYSTVPLDVRIGQNLGEWEETKYDAMVYVQSGVYFGKEGDEWKKARTRGLSRGQVNVQDALKALPDLSPIRGSSRRYGSLTGYIDRDKHWKWFDEEREFKWGGDGKRYHEPGACPRCVSGDSWPYDHDTHRTVMSRPMCGMSNPRKLPWIDGEIIEFDDEEPLEVEET